MLVLTVTQLLETSEGSVPEAFRGKIKKVFKERSGESQGKPWKMQGIIVTDGSKEIEAMFSNRDTVSREMEGKTLYAIAARGDKGLSGLKRKQNSYTPKDAKPGTPAKITEQIWVYEGAEVSFEGAANMAAQQAAPATNGAGNGSGHTAQNRLKEPEGDPKGESAAEAPPAPVDANGLRAGAMKTFNTRLARSSAALSRCLDAAVNVIDSFNERHPKNAIAYGDGTIVEKIAMGLLVNAAWNQKPADVEGFPMKEFQAYAKDGTPVPAAN